MDMGGRNRGVIGNKHVKEIKYPDVMNLRSSLKMVEIWLGGKGGAKVFNEPPSNEQV